MKLKDLFSLLLPVLMLSGCSKTTTSPDSSGCSADIAGTWNLTASGMYENGDCSTGTPPMDTPLYTSSISLSEDCSFTMNSSIYPCNDADNNTQNCTGNWSSTVTSVKVIPASMVQYGSSIETMYTYVLNENKTIISISLPADTTNDEVENYDSCQYTEYTKE